MYRPLMGVTLLALAGSLTLSAVPAFADSPTPTPSPTATAAPATCDPAAAITLTATSQVKTASRFDGTVTTCTDGAAVAAAKTTVKLYRLYDGAWVNTYVRTTTDSAGRFTFRGVNAYLAQDWQVRAAGLTSGTLSVAAAGKAPLSLTLHAKRSGRTVSFTANVHYQADWYTVKPYKKQGGYGFPHGLTLSLQRQVGGRWVTVQHVTTTDANGRNVTATAKAGATASWRLAYTSTTSTLYKASYSPAIQR